MQRLAFCSCVKSRNKRRQHFCSLAGFTQKGSLLFETFIALMLLSIGIVSTLRIFGQALYVVHQNYERKEVRTGLQNFLFPYFAHPDSVPFPEEGTLSVPLELNGQDSNYSVEIHSKPIRPKSDLSDDKTQTVVLQKTTQFYELNFKVTKQNGQEISDFKTVVLQSRQPGRS